MNIETRRTPGAYRRPFDINELVTRTARYQYSPVPGSVGDLLLQAHPSQDRWTALRSLRVFAQKALTLEGLYWPMVLEADEATLSEDETRRIRLTWQQWTDHGHPFGKRAV